MIAQQFHELKVGDRFYYENFFSQTASFTIPQLNEIRKITFSRIICDNLDGISKIQKNAFFMPNAKTNPLVDCSKIPKIDYSVFTTSAFGL